MSTDNNLPAEPQPESPKRFFHLLIILLLLINFLFLIFVFITGQNISSADTLIAQVHDTKKAVMNTYEVELPLTRYILLKMEIQKDIEGNRPTEGISRKISKAILELRSVLEHDNIKSIIDKAKITSIRNELNDMKQLERTYKSKTINTHKE